MTQDPGRDTEFEIERSKREAMFRGPMRVLTERAYAEARRVLNHGGWTGLDRTAVEAVRDGAGPGDLLPSHPFIDNITDAEVVIAGRGPERRLAVLFCHDDFPGVRFGYRFEWEPGEGEGIEQLLLKEAIETGALDEMMQNPPAADEAGIVWADFGLA